MESAISKRAGRRERNAIVTGARRKWRDARREALRSNGFAIAVDGGTLAYGRPPPILDQAILPIGQIMDLFQPGMPMVYAALGATIIAAFIADNRRAKRRQLLNQQGMCARCGAQLNARNRQSFVNEPAVVAGARDKQIDVCENCFVVLRRQERIFWSFIAGGVVCVAFFAWWANR